MSQATISQRPYTNSNLFSGHYLDERIQDLEEWECDDEAREAMEALQSLYDLESGLVEGYREDSLIDNWIAEVIDVLGFGTNVETTLPGGGGYVDVLLYENTETRRDAAEVYLRTEDTADLFDQGVGLVEAKQWGADFSERFSEQRPYRNASHQIKHYLERTPENIQWGVLTNGRKWRLYGTKDYETQTYYEVDLPELLEQGNLEAFKYFYVFFRPESFRERAGSSFLDSVWSESEIAAQQLGEDLQDNVFTALRVLGRGFVETNDLEIDPDDEESLGELKEQSLVLLYRLMFVLYAESRGLINPESTDAIEEYEENFSLDSLRLEIHEEIGEVDSGFESYSEYSTTMWSRLEDLFRLIDEGEESLGIPPYNGGLFDRESHGFLSENAVSNRYLAEVIYRISTTENDEGRYVLADYADLDTRHLGSVYEGLLEHQFRIAPEEYAAVEAEGGQVWKPATEVSVAESVEDVSEGSLYVVNDEGERKATGAYYTPDYVVTYIVEETVDPLLAEIREDLESQGFERGTHEYLGAFYRRVKNLKILDPAMGSGHFLTRATSYVAKQVMEEVRDLEEATVFDEQKVRRDVAKECIYGVDLNGMAVELAKLSMWLETLAADQPLAFLDHHLKAGNSLVGSDVTEVLSNGPTEDDGGQLTLQQSFARVRERTLDHVMDRMQELLEIDNETLADVKSMEELYDDVRSDPFYGRLFELTNVHTAERFDLEVPEGAYERMAQAIDDDAAWAEISEEPWFQTAQAMSDEEAFFHWELEYPEVFFHEDGTRRKEEGFDAVIGNPPYGKEIHEKLKEYINKEFEYQEYQLDRYLLFIEKGFELARGHGYIGLITPNTWLTNIEFSRMRDLIFNNTTMKSLVSYDQNVFPDATVEPIVKICYLGESNGNDISVEVRQFDKQVERLAVDQEKIRKKSDSSVNIFADTDVLSIEDKFSDSPTLGDICEIHLGTKPFQKGKGDPPQTKEIVENKPYISDNKEDDDFRPLLRGSLIERYLIKWEGEYWISFGDWLAEPRYSAKYDAEEKIVIRQTGDSLVGALDEEQFVVMNNMYTMLPKSDNYDINFIHAIFNSEFANWYYQEVINPEKGETFAEVRRGYLLRLPVPELRSQYIENAIEINDESRAEIISKECGGMLYDVNLIQKGIDELYLYTIRLSKCMVDFKTSYNSLNLNLLDHLGSYSDGPTLSEIGLAQPPTGAADSPLTDTAAERENLRVGTCDIVRESPTSLEIRLSARYKPENDDEYETDRWGYTETDPLPALRLSELSDLEADLIEAFVPVAIEEAGGFANFRETATKTNSLVDRLRKLTLPALEDVRGGLESYLETRARAEELEAKIEKTDALIDEIVYELYGLTEEEIEIVEESVAE